MPPPGPFRSRHVAGASVVVISKASPSASSGTSRQVESAGGDPSRCRSLELGRIVVQSSAGRTVIMSGHGASGNHLRGVVVEYVPASERLSNEAEHWSRLAGRLSDDSGRRSLAPCARSAAIGGLWALRRPLGHLGPGRGQGMFERVTAPRLAYHIDQGQCVGTMSLLYLFCFVCFTLNSQCSIHAR
jgi:hypothetical protein